MKWKPRPDLFVRTLPEGRWSYAVPEIAAFRDQRNAPKPGTRRWKPLQLPKK